MKGAVPEPSRRARTVACTGLPRSSTQRAPYRARRGRACRARAIDVAPLAYRLACSAGGPRTRRCRRRRSPPHPQTRSEGATGARSLGSARHSDRVVRAAVWRAQGGCCRPPASQEAAGFTSFDLSVDEGWEPRPPIGVRRAPARVPEQGGKESQPAAENGTPEGAKGRVSFHKQKSTLQIGRKSSQR